MSHVVILRVRVFSRTLDKLVSFTSHLWIWKLEMAISMICICQFLWDNSQANLMAKNACEVGSAYNMDIYILYLCLCHLKHIDALATLIWYLVSPTLIVNHGVVSPTLKVNLTFLVIPCTFLGGLYICNLAINVTYQVICHPISNHPWQYFITSCWQARECRFWPMDELSCHPWQYIFTHS
jgi:hypothetical protein